MARYYSEEAHKAHPERSLTAQPLYWVDEGAGGMGVTFNTARLSELPAAIRKGPTTGRHLYRATLANPTFIAASCASGLGRDLLPEYTAATRGVTRTIGVEEDPPKELRNLLMKYSEFFTQNIHVLEQDPALFVQQVENSSDTPVELLDHIKEYDLPRILPWANPSTLGVKTSLVNKPVGANPCFMTSQGQEVEGDIYGLDVVGIDDDEGYVIIGSTHRSKDPVHKNRNINHGKIDVYDNGTMQCVVTVPCDHPVTALKAFKPAQKGGEMWVVYSSMDRFIRTVHVTSLGAASGSGTAPPKASRGVTFSLETEVLHARFPSHSTTRRPPFGWTTFTVSRDGRLGASAYGQVGSRSQFHYCTAPDYNKRRIKRNLQRKYFRSVFRMWDLWAGHEQWSADQACAPQPLAEIEPVLTEFAGEEPDREPSEKNWHPGGYYVGAIAFSPDDRYLVMALLTEDDGETLSPFLSIRDSVTLQTVWAMNNVIGFNIVSNLEPDLQYWLSCLHGDSPDTWFVAFASVRAVTCVVMNTRDRNYVQGKRAWGIWKNAKLNDMALCELSDELSDKKRRVLISHPDKRMVMQYFPDDGSPGSLGTLGDPGAWNQDERASEAVAFCRKRVFNPYHTPPPASLPPWGAAHALPDLGGEIQRLHVDANAGGIVITVSRLGEIKVSDLSRYMAYNLPERHEDAVISCAVTLDHRHVTTGTKRGSIGVWDARTGVMIAIQQKPMPSLTPATAVATTPDGAYILCMQSNQIHYFRSKSLVEYNKNSGRDSKQQCNRVFHKTFIVLYFSYTRGDSILSLNLVN